MEELPADFKTVTHNYHVIAANVRAGLDPNHGTNGEPEYVEVYYPGASANLVHNRPRAPKKGEILLQRLYSTGARGLLSKGTTIHSLTKNSKSTRKKWQLRCSLN